jgi:hypothetical protein
MNEMITITCTPLFDGRSLEGREDHRWVNAIKERNKQTNHTKGEQTVRARA